MTITEEDIFTGTQQTVSKHSGGCYWWLVIHLCFLLIRLTSGCYNNTRSDTNVSAQWVNRTQ